LLQSTNYIYDGTDRLSVNNYDNNGNTTNAASKAYTYDFENRLTGFGTNTIVYDGTAIGSARRSAV